MGRQSGESILKKITLGTGVANRLVGGDAFFVWHVIPTPAGNNCPCKVSTIYASEIRKAIRNEAETSRLAGDP